MIDTARISFQVNTTDAAVALGLEAWIDNQKFFDTDHIQIAQQVAVDIADDDAVHSFRLILKGKQPQHTVIDASGQIVSDAMLTITQVALDGIQLGHMFAELAVYTHDFNNTAPMTQGKFYGQMGCNGTVELQFSTPIYLWLLDHM